MRELSFIWLDVFSDRPFAGNALCVVLDAGSLSDSEMQSIARETNLSETTFVLPPSRPEATYRVRIFTPGGELAFAGHPTLGTAAALLYAKRITGPQVIQETKSGLTPLEVTSEWAVMEAPPVSLVAEPDPGPVARALGLKPDRVAADGHGPAIFQSGVRHLVVPLGSQEELSALRPDSASLLALSRELGVVGAYPFSLLPPGSEQYARARLFAPLYGIPEDPATGSAAAPLGAFLARAGLLPSGSNAFWYEQGVEMGRPSRLWVEVNPGGRVRVGGQVRLLGTGQFHLP